MLPGYTGLVSTGPVPTFLSLLVLLLTRRFEVEDFARVSLWKDCSKKGGNVSGKVAPVALSTQLGADSRRSLWKRPLLSAEDLVPILGVWCQHFVVAHRIHSGSGKREASFSRNSSHESTM
jgi:hypothetical protein